MSLFKDTEIEELEVRLTKGEKKLEELGKRAEKATAKLKELKERLQKLEEATDFDSGLSKL